LAAEGLRLDAQDLDRAFHVALGLGERSLGIHHPGPGSIAEGLDVGGRDRHFESPPSGVACTGAASAGGSGAFCWSEPDSAGGVV